MTIKILLMYGILMGIPCIAVSQTKTASLPTLPPRTDLGSTDPAVRISAFSKLMGIDPAQYLNYGMKDAPSLLQSTLIKDPKDADRRKQLLIELLENENRIVDPYRQREGRELSEGYGNYYGDLVWAVSSLKDVSSMNALLGAFLSGGMATGTLMSFGSASVDPVIGKLKDPDYHARATAARVLGVMLEQSDIASDVRLKSKIRSSLIQASTDSEYLVRRNSVAGLIQFADDECISIVEDLSQNDPYRADFMDNRYLVREEALKALQSRAK